MKIITLFVIVLTIAMYSGSKSNETVRIALLIGLTIFLFYLVENAGWSRCYITNIHLMADNKIKIIYYDKDFKKEYINDIKSLTFDKKFVWYKIRGRAPYLIIQNLSDGFKIKQHDVGSWDEATIDKIEKIGLSN